MKKLLKVLLPFILFTPGCFITIQERPYYGPRHHFHRKAHWCDWCGCYHEHGCH